MPRTRAGKNSSTEEWLSPGPCPGQREKKGEGSGRKGPTEEWAERERGIRTPGVLGAKKEGASRSGDWGFPGGPVAKTPHSHIVGRRFTI